jgi:type I restriction enzyme S subunit
MDSTSRTVWTDTTIGDVIEIFDSKRIPLSGSKRKQRQGQYPYYGASGVIDYIDGYIFNGRYLLIAEDGENLNSRKVPVAFFAKGKFWVNNHAHIIRAKDGVADDQFLFSWFAQANISGYITGAAQPKLSQENLRRIELRLPPLPTQRKIASILSAYDDLIENNLRRIKILEEMAQNLYREWFVKFRFPGHQHAHFTDSPLGRIPEGWAVKRLGEILELNYGKALKQETRRGGDVPVYGSSGVVGYHDLPLVNGPGIVVGRKGNVGSIFWSDVDFYPIDTVYFVTSKMPLRFLFYELQTKNFLNNDAAVPGLNRNQAYSLETLAPPADILAWFCQFADDFERQAAVLRFQNTTLRRTRDLLLPRLISGEVDVSELDIAVPKEVAV